MNPRRVLVVDDDPDIREVARMSLELVGGYEVETATSGLDALEVIRGYQPDALLLDVMMPGLDGPGLVARLRDDTATEALPVVLLTAKTPLHTTPDWDRLNIAGVIAKPFDPMTLPTQFAALIGW